jgi:hypothetical protein
LHGPGNKWKDDDKLDFGKIVGEDIDGFIWLRIGTSVGVM